MSDSTHDDSDLRIDERVDRDRLLRLAPAGELVLAIADAGSDGWDLEIDPRVSETASRVIQLTGVGPQFCP